METKVRLFPVSIDLFDPDLAYTYADAICQVDGLAQVPGVSSVFTYEECSNWSEEWSKPIVRLLLGPSFPPCLWSGRVRDKESKVPIINSAASEVQENLENQAEMFRKCLENAYVYASEATNALLYSYLILSLWAWDKVRRDTYITNSNNEAVTSSMLNMLINYLERIRSGKSSLRINEKFNQADTQRQKIETLVRKLRDNLQYTSTAILYSQLGTKKYSAEGIANFICALKEHIVKNLGKLYVVMSRRVEEEGESKGIIEVLRKRLENSISINVIYEGRAKGEAMEEILDKFAEKEPNTLVLIMQDHSKALLRKVLDLAYSRKVFNIMIFPESYYVSVKFLCSDLEEERIDRFTRACGPFLSKGICQELGNRRGGKSSAGVSEDELLKLLALKSIVIIKGRLLGDD